MISSRTSAGAILVQGAAGFVARSLLNTLSRAGYDQFLLVDPKPVDPCVLAALSSRGARVQVHRSATLPCHDDVPPLAAIVTLAGVTDVDVALADPAQAFSENLRIALELAEWMRKDRHGTRVIYMSSDEVLGESWVPLPVEAPLSPTQPYAASKAAAEMLLHNYRDVYRLNLVTLRSCNLIGHNQRAKKLIPVTVACLLSSHCVPVYGSGTQVREWMAVEDVCEAILALIRTAAPPGIYQASSGVHVSVLGVIDIVARAIARKAEIREVPDRRVHDRAYAMDSSRLRSVGWCPMLEPRVAIAIAAREMAGAPDPPTLSIVPYI